jgi:hypothetical protein
MSDPTQQIMSEITPTLRRVTLVQVESENLQRADDLDQGFPQR